MENENKNSVFSKFSNPQSIRSRYDQSRLNLLLVAVFSLINVIMLATNNFSYFLFSAAVPYLITDIGMDFCGRYPEEFYEGGYAAYNFFDDTFFYVLLAVALFIVAIYVALFFLSAKRRVGFLIAAAALFAVDTVIMFMYYNLMSSIPDIIFHAWVIVSLVIGIVDHFRTPQEA